MRGRLVFWLVLLLAHCLGGKASAQSEATVQSLKVSLLPQYDDRRLLIIYEATLDKPGTAALAVPDGVELHAAASSPDGMMLEEMEARFEGGKDGRFVAFAAPNRAVRLEFYQDVIPPAPDRFVDFTLPGQRYALAKLLWMVVFPLEASELVMEPPMALRGKNHIGMETFERDAGPLPAREEARQTIEWRRESNAPSIVLPDEPAPDSGAVPPPRDLRQSYMALALGFTLGLALVVHGLWRMGRQGAAVGHDERGEE